MRLNVFRAKCITNLHVGNGDVNYNIIDQEVERDPVTGLPIINASGVKGALREFFEKKLDKNKINEYFGNDEGDSTQGTYKFLQADILFRPLRVSADGNRSYVLATTAEIISDFSAMIKGLNGNIDGTDGLKETDQSIEIEGGAPIKLYKAEGKWRLFTDKEIAIVDNFDKFDLPVIARNVLDDNGISKNLWYEEFVPHESVFGLIILTPDEMDPEFKKALTSEAIQFGGNTSIGYGLMNIREVEL